VGGTVPVRFPSEEYPGEVGYHIEGNWWEAGSTGRTCGPGSRTLDIGQKIMQGRGGA
jgi:hypothetical protein